MHAAAHKTLYSAIEPHAVICVAATGMYYIIIIIKSIDSLTV